MEKIYGNLRVPAQYHLTPPSKEDLKGLLTCLCPLIRPNPYFLPRNGVLLLLMEEIMHQLIWYDPNFWNASLKIWVVPGSTSTPYCWGNPLIPTFHEGSLLIMGPYINPYGIGEKNIPTEVRPPWLPASASSVDSWHSSCGSASEFAPREPSLGFGEAVQPVTGFWKGSI